MFAVKNIITDFNDWFSNEFNSFTCGDKRLKKRLIKIAKAKFSSPTASLNEACGSWGDAKGAYRFFGNSQVSVNQIISPHIESTVSRVLEQKGDVLAIQDTTDIILTHHPKTSGLGNVTTGKGFKSSVKGFRIHSTFCVSFEGEPLGLLVQKHFIHTNKRVANEHKKLPIEEKESFRWIESLNIIKSDTHLKSKLIVVADRECDIFEFLSCCHQQDIRYVIRAARNRKIHFGNNFDSEHLFESIKKTKPIGSFQTKIHKKGQLGFSSVKLNLRILNTYLIPPVIKKRFEEVYTTLIHVEEESQKQKDSKIEWFLLTNEKVDSVVGAKRIIQIYKQRWHIENFHRVLKSGFQVENARLGKAESIKKLAALCSVLAYRLYWVEHICRIKPKTPAHKILNPEEFRTLIYYTRRKKTIDFIDANKLSVYEAIKIIAKMGGYLDRKCDGPPGMITIWRGWYRLHTLVSLFSELLPEETCG